MKTNKIPVFPDDFYDFNNGVDIDDKTINEWIKECVGNLEDVGDSWTIASGNTRVFAKKYEDCIDVNVSKGYYNWDTYRG